MSYRNQYVTAIGTLFKHAGYDGPNMDFAVLTGTITQTENSNETAGPINAIAGQKRRDTYSWSFRIDGHPVKLRQDKNASLTAGDRVTAVGRDRDGTLHILAMRNETTGAAYKESTGWFIWGGTGLILVGLPLSPILIGIPMIVEGALLIYHGRKISRCNQLLDSTSRRASA